MKNYISITFFILVFFSSLSLSQVKVIAHRGGASMAPENTIAAWEKAIEVKADFIELDIQLSSDDSMMIIHDETVNRTTNGTGLVADLTYDSLRSLDAGFWFSVEFIGEIIPTFAEALQIAKESENEIGIIAEIKSSDVQVVPLVLKMIQDWGMNDRVVVSSFNFYQLTQIKNLDSTIQVQFFIDGATTTAIDQVNAINGEWLGSDGTPTSFLLDYAHSINILYNAWTINSASQMKTLIELGVDAITTDYPLTLISVGDTSAPSDVSLNEPFIDQTTIKLSWQPGLDLQSGISGYFIFRDEIPDPTKLFAEVDTVTEYFDNTLTELKTFYYRIKAINGAGIESINFSNPVSATTGTDITAPKLLYATSNIDASTVYLEFNEPLEKESAEFENNFLINNSSILESQLGLDTKTVILKTMPLTDSLYEMSIDNIRDLALSPNSINNQNISLLNETKNANRIAAYTLDFINICGTDTIITDVSENGNHGFIENGTTLSEGILGNGLSYDGVDDFVQFTNSASFDALDTAVTISLWTKLAYLPKDLVQPIGPLFDSESDQYVIYEDRGNNELRFKVTTNVRAERPGIQGADLITAQWINVVGVYDGTNAKVFLNGVLKDSHPLSGAIKTGQVAMLGKSDTSLTPSFFKGSIDQVQIFNKALSENEVLELYNNIKRDVFYLPLDINEQISRVNDFVIYQNFPNPFNSYTTIAYFLPKRSTVSIKIYDVLGRSSIILLNKKEEEPGFQQIKFDSGAYDLSSGIYFYQIVVDNFVLTKKMILLR